MYSDILDRFTRSGRPVTDLSRFAGLMRKLGDPQDRLTFIHVAGTNGKGSAVRMFSRICTLSGYRTGEFTSPYINRYNDRICIDGEYIPDEDIEDILGEIMPHVDGGEGYSQFEITTAIALMWYVRKKCDVVVFETGLGGLLDCTNIITTGILQVIMSVSYDHTNVLGNTLREIAGQKAGIIKEGVPTVLYAPNEDEVTETVKKTAEKKHSRLIIPDLSAVSDETMSEDGCTFTYKGRGYRTAMTGRHQIYNAAAVIEGAQILRKKLTRITDGTIHEGIASAKVPSRLEILGHSPLVIRDGAHNPDAMRRLAEFVGTLKNSPKVLVYGQMMSKDYVSSAEYIAPVTDLAICIDDFAAGQNTVPKEELAALFPHSETSDAAHAYDRAAAAAGRDGAVIIAGSLYMKI
ncbi:MAG: bifunctional folylpolyglutamate synthase/dihydrofolate synthase [Oscillospiraceae bacterium]|nr:bifunctional folylpolyglutamate synthase/dihydrofolate synthase [Oscillospiraceae bacterium]